MGRAGLNSFLMYKRAWKSPEEIKKIPDIALRNAVAFAYDNTDFYNLN